jgi:hypothetical protein
MEVSGQIHALAALFPGTTHLVSIGQEAGWASEPVWTQSRRKKSCPREELNPGHPVYNPVTKLKTHELMRWERHFRDSYSHSNQGNGSNQNAGTPNTGTARSNQNANAQACGNPVWSSSDCASTVLLYRWVSVASNGMTVRSNCDWIGQ